MSVRLSPRRTGTSTGTASILRDAAALEDAIVARSVLLVYGSYIEDGQAEAGRNMLDSLIAALPPELRDVRASILQRADSVTCSVPRFVRQFGLALRTCREHGGAVLMG